MPSLFNALPGIDVPVGGISKSLAQMWTETEAAGGAAPSSTDVKATQINLVLHFGFSTTPEDAVARFQDALRFSVRYPSRVVVLCPLLDDAGRTDLKAKIYGECFLGKSKGDTRCVEFVMLSYPMNARQYLESQVSICLSTDLPTYYWVHRFSSSARLNDYQYLLRRSKRVMFDSGLAPDDAMTFPWPRPDVVRDLVHARLLPVRQTLGQFLSAFAPAVLLDGLVGYSVAHAPEVAAEGRVLLAWLKDRLSACGPTGATVPGTLKALDSNGAGSFEVRFDYANQQRFHWRGDLAKGNACTEASFGCEKIRMPGAISLLSPEAALAEAMFF